MAILRATSFEAGVTTVDLASVTNASLQTTIKHSGSYAMLVNRTTTQTGFGVLQGINTGGAQAALAIADCFLSFFFRVETLPGSNDEEILRCNTSTSTTNKCAVRINSAGKLVIYDINGVAQGTTTNALSLNTWYRIDFRAQNSTSGICEVRIWDDNGHLIETLTVSNCNMGATSVGNIRLGKVVNQNGQGVKYYYDDVVIDGAAYAPANYAIGCLKLSANGATQQWTAGTGASDYTQINETPASTAEYVASDGTAGCTGHFRLPSFVVAGLLGMMGAAIAIIPKVLASDAGLAATDTFKLGIHNDAGDSFAANNNLPASSAPGDYTPVFTSVPAISSYPLTSPGLGADDTSTGQNAKNGTNATGFGCSGGGAGYYGGNGGNGLYGGGGSGAAGYTLANRVGGTGGQGVVVIQTNTGAVFVLISGSSWAVPSNAGITSIKVWAIGAGGGGAGATSIDVTSAGGGGAGRVEYKTYSVTGGDTVTYSLGTGGLGGTDANNGSDGGDTSVTVGGVTIAAGGGKGGQYNNGQNALGGVVVTAGDGGVNGGRGGAATGDNGGASGGAIGGVNGIDRLAAGDNRGADGVQSVDISGLFVALTNLADTTLTQMNIENLRVAIVEGTASVNSRVYWVQLCIVYVPANSGNMLEVF